MTAIEGSIIAAVFVATIPGYLGGVLSKLAVMPVTIAIILIVIHLIKHHFRWQMIPVYLVVVSLSAIVFWGLQPVGAIKYIGMSAGIVLSLLSVVLTTGFPILGHPGRVSPSE